MSSITGIHNIETDVQEHKVDVTEKLTPLYKVIDDDSMTSFLKNPRLITSGSLGGDGISNFLPVYLFFYQRSVRERTKFLALINGIMELEVRITCPVYSTGLYRLVLDFKKGRSSPSVYRAMGMDGVTIDISTRAVAKLRFPIAIMFPYLALSDGTDLDAQREIPNVSMRGLTDFRDTSTGVSVNIDYQVYASLPFATMNTPTGYGTSDVYVASSKEMGSEATGTFSYPASIVELATKGLKDLPVIGKFMYATSIAASAVKNIAILFGFSRPSTLQTADYSANISTAIGPLDVKGYTLDPLAEIPITFDVLGLNECSLSFQNTIGRYGLAKKIQWLTSATENTFIDTVEVTPTFADSTAAFTPTPLGYFSAMYRMWRGSIKYRFTVAANSFVRGRLRFIWCPDATFDSTYYAANKSDVLAHSYNVMLDLSTTTTIEMVIPWGQMKPYMPVSGFDNNATSNYCTNGCVCVVVEEPLRVPASTWVAEILIEMAAADDYELAIPSNFIMNEYSVHVEDDTAANALDYQGNSLQVNYNNPPPYLNNREFSDLGPTGDIDTYIHSSLQFNNPEVKHVENEGTQTVAGAATHYIGEKFLSHRPLLKRFHLTAANRGSTNDYEYQLQPAYPIDKKVIVVGGIHRLSGFKPNPISWCGYCFAGYRGSTRLNFIDQNRTGQSLTTNRVTTFRANGDLYTKHYVADGVSSQVLTSPDTAGFTKHFHNLGDNITVEHPYQYYFNFIPTQMPSESFYNSTFAGVMINGGLYELRHAIGEDFNFVLWSGIPTIRHSAVYTDVA